MIHRPQAECLRHQGEGAKALRAVDSQSVPPSGCARACARSARTELWNARSGKLLAEVNLLRTESSQAQRGSLVIGHAKRRRRRRAAHANPPAIKPNADGSGMTVIFPVMPGWPVTVHVYQKSPASLGVQLMKSDVGPGSAVKSAIGVSVHC